jgi:hypothetical protein
MKKILLSLILFSTVGFLSKTQAQNCTIQNVSTQINDTTYRDGGIEVDFTVSFDLDANSGNKGVLSLRGSNHNILIIGNVQMVRRL